MGRRDPEGEGAAAVTEEAFIRAVVDHPGQDTPRLVYADWLDDHAAPDRAAFLRAEAAWAAPWRTGVRPAEPVELQATVAELDPLWVARVSRPPLGVCCEHFLMEDVGPPVSPEQLHALEADIGFTLPVEYVAFLLNHNGGRPYPNGAWPPSTYGSQDVMHDWFYPVVKPATDEPVTLTTYLMRHRVTLQTRLARYRATVFGPVFDVHPSTGENLPGGAEWYRGCVPIGYCEHPDFERVLSVAGLIGQIDWMGGPVASSHGVPTFPEYLAAYRALDTLDEPDVAPTRPPEDVILPPPTPADSDIPW
ncbi:MAG: TIGR02996 domain-containing protein [Gemmataceae bacterium]